MQKKMEDEQLAEQKTLYGKYPYRGLMKREASISVYGVPSGPSTQQAHGGCRGFRDQKLDGIVLQIDVSQDAFGVVVKLVC